MNTNFSNELQQLQMELRAQNFDIIRFSTYRIACKLRFIQKKLNFHLLDLLNVIESLRECLTSLSCQSNLNTINSCISKQIHSHLVNNNQFLSINHLTIFLTSIYTNLNKRLPLSRQILHIDKCVHSAIAWFLYVYNCDQLSIRFNSFRVVLILLCTGKLIDKMRHLFTCSLSTSSSSSILNTLTYNQVDELLHEILALPYALQEISYSTYNKNSARSIFSHLSSPITLDGFLDLLIYSNRTPICLQWLVLFHRLISVENVIHRVKCSACQRPSFSGFRYKCQQCHNRTYQLCQDCFWRGRTSDQHLSTHEMKEYTYFISPNKDIRYSIRKSLQCMPRNEKHNQRLNSLTIDNKQQLSEENFIRNNKSKLIINKDKNISNKIDNDEHKQIALYTKQFELIDEKQNLNPIEIQSQIKSSFNQHHSRRRYTKHQSEEKKLMIAKLEAENRRISHEINTLRSKLKQRSLNHMNTNDDHAYSDTDVSSKIEKHYIQTLPNQYSNIQYKSNPIHYIRRAGSVETTNKNSYFEHELQTLLKRKHQLESRIYQLQQSREELTSQLHNLSRNSHNLQQQSTIFNSHDRLNISPSCINSHIINFKKNSFQSYSTPSTPIHKRLTNHLQTDLLLAADSLTSAMSSLVQQLNTEDNESFLTVLKPENKFNFYSYDSDNRTDEEFFLISDDDNF
ncbi:unnamed protein product [Rotaria sordida]|uniref:ZZ-type domain-containing protein n=1 Tax=Rotaria sordida TaxID=392033 RepID=A0A813TX03_9BILA|nr:unnamed protein product [Rotaria sordida]CAF1032942.1 unnamed protein product [Rotaria sordida]